MVRGTVSLYERDGSFQLIAYDIQTLGKGMHKETLEELKKRLYQEGLFDPGRKKPLPSMPRTVGVITSPEGAALQDIISTFRRLNPMVRLIVYPAAVQGDQGRFLGDCGAGPDGRGRALPKLCHCPWRRLQ